MTIVKHNLKAVLGLLVVTFLLVPMTSTVAAQGPGMGEMQGPHGPPDRMVGNDGTVWINTDIITIMANSEIPMFHFWFKDDANGSMSRFSATYVALTEFEDSNGDGAFQSDEVLYFVPLAAYEWTLQTGSIEDNGVTTEVWLKYIKGGARTVDPHSGMPMGAMPSVGSVDRFEDVTLQIWAHIYLEDYQGEVSDDAGVKANFTVAGGSELKMDIEFGNFPFTTETSSVALQVQLNENEASQTMARHHWMTRERFGNVTGTSGMNWTARGNETMFQRMNGTCTQLVEFVPGINEAAEGYFSWVDQAVVTLPGGATEVVNVTASYMPSGDGLTVYLAYPNFDGGSLLHDPSIGLYPEMAPVLDNTQTILLVSGIGLVAIVAVIFAVKRKR